MTGRVVSVPRCRRSYGIGRSVPDNRFQSREILDIAVMAAGCNGVVAGSAAKAYRQPDEKYGDIDVFFLGPREDARANLVAMMARLMALGFRADAVNVPEVWNLTKVGFPPVQLVVPEVEVVDAYSLIAGFTLGPQQYALIIEEAAEDATRIYTPAALSDSLTGEVTVVNDANPLKVVWSLGKYRGKGYPVKMHQFVAAMNKWAGLTEVERATMIMNDPYDFADNIHFI